MEPIPNEDLLADTHEFPGTFRFKAIGEATNDFEARVVAAAASELSGPSEVEHSVRETKGGRHIAVSLEVTVQTPDQVRAIYAAIRQVEGLALLL